MRDTAVPADGDRVDPRRRRSAAPQAPSQEGAARCAPTAQEENATIPEDAASASRPCLRRRRSRGAPAHAGASSRSRRRRPRRAAPASGCSSPIAVYSGPFGVRAGRAPPVARRLRALARPRAGAGRDGPPPRGRRRSRARSGPADAHRAPTPRTATATRSRPRTPTATTTSGGSTAWCARTSRSWSA